MEDHISSISQSGVVSGSLDCDRAGHPSILDSSHSELDVVLVSMGKYMVERAHATQAIREAKAAFKQLLEKRKSGKLSPVEADALRYGEEVLKRGIRDLTERLCYVERELKNLERAARKLKKKSF